MGTMGALTSFNPLHCPDDYCPIYPVSYKISNLRLGLPPLILFPYAHILSGLRPNASAPALLSLDSHSFSACDSPHLPIPTLSCRRRKCSNYPISCAYPNVFGFLPGWSRCLSELGGEPSECIVSRGIISLLVYFGVSPTKRFGWGVGALFHDGASISRSYPSGSNARPIAPHPNQSTSELGS